jgi:hypothetical protein
MDGFRSSVSVFADDTSPGGVSANTAESTKKKIAEKELKRKGGRKVEKQTV